MENRTCSTTALPPAPPGRSTVVALSGVEPQRRRGGRTMVTILFTDIVDSTARAFELGDHRWLTLLDRHDNLIRRLAIRFGGRVLRHTGDGALVVFATTTDAVQAAVGMRSAIRRLGLEIRASVHAGECVMREGEPAGVAFHIGARLLALADAGEVLVSDPVRKLARDSRLDFVERGAHALRGLPGEWTLYAAQPHTAVAGITSLAAS